MPQLMVCPTSLNAVAMITGLLDTTYQKVLTPLIMVKLEEVLYRIKIMDDYYHFLQAQNIH